MKLVFKVLLFGLVGLVALGLLAMAGMPGARDGERHLAGDYYFTYSGGFQNSITEERDGISGFVIGSKVEEFIMHDNGIFVSRRPILGEKIGDNRMDYRLSYECEYYRIDVPKRRVDGPFTLAEVRTSAQWAFLKQLKEDRDFGETLCKLDAVKGSA